MRMRISITMVFAGALLAAACGRPAKQADQAAGAPATASATATPGPVAAVAAGPSLSATDLAKCSNAAPAGLQGPPLPAYLAFLPCVMQVKRTEHEDWTQTQIPPDPWASPGPETLKQGKRWHAVGVAAGGGADNDATWAALRPGFIGAGWQEVKVFSGQPLTAVVRYARGGLDVWANVGVSGSDADVEVIEVAPPPIVLTLLAPAPTPERFLAAKGDFPFLPPLPGSTFKAGHHDPSPVSVTLPGATEPEIVASGSTIKSYKQPDGVSMFEWFTLYQTALAKAGWTIENKSIGGDAAITAHYGLNGRNIWAYLHMDDGYTLQVADEGGVDLGATLARACHVALTGVLFDFDKATLKPESDPVLDRVRGVMAKTPALRLEVQGHTDNVGSDAYNQTLSEARAAAVAAWLTQHGIAADRLTSKGYGKTRPVADNATDEGRAKNRRVEVAIPACTPPRK
jgi:outer membrane protein OmpA-like peptidoglycan-associated protein